MPRDLSVVLRIIWFTVSVPGFWLVPDFAGEFERGHGDGQVAGALVALACTSGASSGR